MSASYGELILDEADSGGNLIVRGSVTIALSQRVPDAGDDLIFGQAPVTGVFRAGGPPSVRLPFNDTFGPQGDDTPGTTYTITYNGVPGSPAPWSFYFISTNGDTQRLSALASTPAAQPGQMYMPLPSGTPSARNLPFATGAGEASAWGVLQFGDLPNVLTPSGDETGADDDTAITASLLANGRTVLAAGQWYVSDPGLITSARCLLGCGPATVINVVADGTGLTVTGPGQSLVGDFAMVLGSGAYGLVINGNYDAHYKDIIMSGSSAAGGIKINGDDSLEQHFTDIVMRDVGGINFDYERTTSTYTGSLYLDRVRLVTPPAGAYGFRFNSTAGSPSLNTVFMTQCVADAFYEDAYYANNVAQVFVGQCWFACISGAAAGSAPLHIKGGYEHTYEGCLTYNGISAGAGVKVEGGVSLIYIGGGHIFDGASGNTAISTSGVTSGQVALGDYVSACGTLTDNPAAFASIAQLGSRTLTAYTPVSDLIATTTSEYSGPSFGAYNSNSALGNQAGFAWQHGIENAGGTEGFITLIQRNYQGNYVANLCTIDLNAQTWQFLIPLSAAKGLDVPASGYGVSVAEGSNAKQGTNTLTAGSVVVANTAVTASSRIFLTAQSPGGTPGALYVSARTAGTSFTVHSTSGADTSTFAYEIFEPG